MGSAVPGQVRGSALPQGALLWPQLQACFGDTQARGWRRRHDDDNDDGNAVARGQCLSVGCLSHVSRAFHTLIHLTL